MTTMVKLYCRALHFPDSLRAVEVEVGSEFTAPDEYVYEYVNMTEVGQATFVEVSTTEKGPWELWVCECFALLADGRFMLKTGRYTYADANRDLQKYAHTSKNPDVRKWHQS